MVKYWPWIVMALWAIGWFAFFEVRAIATGNNATLSDALRTFTHANWIAPWAVYFGLGVLGIHLYRNW